MMESFQTRNKSRSILFTRINERTIYEKQKDKIHPRLSSLIRKRYTDTLKEVLEINKRVNESFIKNIFLLQIIKSGYFRKITNSFFQTFISLFSTILYIVSTYYTDSQNNENSIIQASSTIKYLEITISGLIIISLIAGFLLTKRKKRYFFRFGPVLDIVTILPLIIQFFVSISSVGFVRIFRLVRVIRVVRILKFISQRKSSKSQNENKLGTEIFRSCVIISTYIFLSTGVVHYLNSEFNDYFKFADASKNQIGCWDNSTFIENELIFTNKSVNIQLECDTFINFPSKILTFDSAFYFVVITITTLGYGDIIPSNILAKVLVSFIVILIVIIVTKQMGEINEILTNRDLFSMPFKSKRKHVIIGGFFRKNSLKKFLDEFYYIDHKKKVIGNRNKSIKIVIIQPNYPDREINEILSESTLINKVHYIKGDILDKQVLKKAKISLTKHVFLLSNQENMSIKSDQFLSLACKSISQISDTKIFVQYNYSQSLINDWTDFNVSFSSNQIKNHVMVKNCFVHGFSTLIMNLTCSSSAFYIKDIVETPWLLEYIAGASHEFYIVKPETKEDKLKGNFIEFVKEVFLEFGLIVIGVKHKVYYKNRAGEQFKDVFYYEYLINPLNYTFEESDSIIVIAKDMTEAMKIFKKSDFYIGNDDFVDFNHLRYKFINIAEDCKDNDIPEILSSTQEFSSIDCRLHLSIYLQDHFIIFCTEDLLIEFIPVFNKTHRDIIYFVCDESQKINKTEEKENFRIKSKWEKFSNVIKININYYSEEDIESLNLNLAKHVFIQSFSKDGLNISDSGIIPLVKIIERRFRNCKYTLELVEENSVKSLNNVVPKLSKSDNSGHIDSRDLIEKIPFKVWPKFAKSDIFFSSSTDTLLPFSYHNKGLIELLQKILGIENEKNKENKTFHNIQENGDFSVLKYIGDEKLVYGDIVRYFLDLDIHIICLGIYRSVKEDLENPLPYLATNPDSKVFVYPNDELIFIGKSPRFQSTQKKNTTKIFHIENYSSMKNLNKNLLNHVITKKDTLGIDSQLALSKFDSVLVHLDDNELLDEFKKNFIELRESMKLSRKKLSNYFDLTCEDNDDLVSPSQFNRRSKSKTEKKSGLIAKNKNELEDIFKENKTERYQKLVQIMEESEKSFDSEDIDYYGNSTNPFKQKGSNRQTQAKSNISEEHYLELENKDPSEFRINTKFVTINDKPDYHKLDGRLKSTFKKIVRNRSIYRKKENEYAKKIRKMFEKNGMNCKEAYHAIKSKEKEIFIKEN